MYLFARGFIQNINCTDSDMNPAYNYICHDLSHFATVQFNEGKGFTDMCYITVV